MNAREEAHRLAVFRRSADWRTAAESSELPLDADGQAEVEATLQRGNRLGREAIERTVRQRMARAQAQAREREQRAPQPAGGAAAGGAGAGTAGGAAAGTLAALAEAITAPTPPSPPVGGSGHVSRAEPSQNVEKFQTLNRLHPHRPPSAPVHPPAAGIPVRSWDAPTELVDADDVPSILRAVAAICWRKGLPNDRQPAVSDLEEFLRSRRCPADVLGDADALLAAVMGAAGWRWRLLLDVGLCAVRWLDEGGDVASVREVHAAWLAGREASRHPLDPLVAAWQRLDPKAVPIVIDDRPRIMPRAIAQIEDGAPRYYLARFPRAVHRAPDGQLALGFAHEDEAGPTLPANIWTMGLEDAERRGAVVPLALRLFVACILHASLECRHGQHPVLLTGAPVPLTLRRFVSWGYDGRWQPGRDWDRLQAACDVMNDTRLPYEHNGLLWERRPVTIDKPLTYDRRLMDEPWPVVVHLPPGDGTGPPIDFRRLQRWARKRGGNSAAYRALINLSFRWWIEGKRVIPPRGRRGVGLRRYDPKVYDRLTDQDRDLLCYPHSTGKKRRDLRLADANAALDLLVQEGDAVDVDGRLLPPRPERPTGDSNAQRVADERTTGDTERTTGDTNTPEDRL